MCPMVVETVSVSKLRPYTKNARTHSKKQIWQIAESIKRFGFTNPVLISDDDEIIAGHGRVEAAKLLGIESVPTVRLSHLNAAWDREVLAIELQALVDLDFDVEITGFSLAEIDLVLDEAGESSPNPEHDAGDEVPPLIDPVLATSRPGDLWLLGRQDRKSV